MVHILLQALVLHRQEPQVAAAKEARVPRVFQTRTAPRQHLLLKEEVALKQAVVLAGVVAAQRAALVFPRQLQPLELVQRVAETMRTLLKRAERLLVPVGNGVHRQ